MTASGAGESTPNWQLSTPFFEACGEDDRERIASVLAANVKWTIPGHPLPGTKHGINEVLAFDELEMVVDASVADDRRLPPT